MAGRFLVSGFATALVFMAAPSLAQDGSEVAANRTPDTAQKFLAAMPPFSVTSEGIALQPDVISASGACVTRFAGPAMKYDGPRRNAEPLRFPFDADPRGALEERSIDWSKVEKISLLTTTNTYWFLDLTESMPKTSYNGGNYDNKRLHYRTLETAQRALAAAQFLQKACDQTKDFGF